MIAITLNHLNYFPNGLTWLTMKGELFVSSAEGFFLISGIVLGIVRGAKLISRPFSEVAKLLLKRSLQLYVVYAVATIGFTLVGWWFFMDNPALKPGIAAPETSVLTMIWNVLTFSYLYGWVDYLRLYFFFLLASPLVMWLLRRGWWWLVMAGSVALWFVAPEHDWPQSVYTQPLTWQLLFFSGMTIGFYYKQIAHAWNSLMPAVRSGLTALIIGLTIMTIYANYLLAFGGKEDYAMFLVVSPIRDSLMPFFDKENLPLARIALFALWFAGSFLTVRLLEKYIVKLFGWLLLPFGTNSLYVYIVSGVIIFFVHLFIPEGDARTNFLIITGIIAAVWLMVRYKVLFKVIPR